MAEINDMPDTKRVKTSLGDPALPVRDSHHHSDSASMSTAIEHSTTSCDTLDYINDQDLVSKPVTYIQQTTEASSNIINETGPQSKETSCCNHYKSKLQNSQRSNYYRLKRRVSELKDCVKELQIQVPPTEYDSDSDVCSDDEDESCCESEPANTGKESEHEPSSDYYVWPSCGNESSDDDGDWTPHIESEDSETNDEMNQNSFSDMK
ncbi:Hypothetical predicted protein [Paramuricea clavata]|nr:Hypothetical predicted protein [Paramuricea clavata]